MLLQNLFVFNKIKVSVVDNIWFENSDQSVVVY